MKNLVKMAALVGLHIGTWSPGDGWTRYRIFDTERDYFSGSGLFTGKLSEAYHFVLGYSYGLDKGAE